MSDLIERLTRVAAEADGQVWDGLSCKHLYANMVGAVIDELHKSGLERSESNGATSGSHHNTLVIELEHAVAVLLSHVWLGGNENPESTSVSSFMPPADTNIMKAMEGLRSAYFECLAPTNCDAKASGNPDFEDGFNPFMDGYDVDPDGPQNQLLPFRDKDIRRGLILLRTSNNAHGFTNCHILTDRIEKLPAKGRKELARMMRNIATEIDDEPQATGWRDIESAPRDGTAVLLFNIRWKLPYAAKWLPNVGHEGCPWVSALVDHSWPDEAFSHWQPLPPPPGQEGPLDRLQRLGQECDQIDALRASVRSTIKTSLEHEAALRAENAELKARYDKLEAAARMLLRDPGDHDGENIRWVSEHDLNALRSVVDGGE